VKLSGKKKTSLELREDLKKRKKNRIADLKSRRNVLRDRDS